MSQVESATTRSPRLRILLVIKCLGFGGAERLLVDMVARGDTHSFDYEVAYVLAAEHALVPDIASAGTPVHGLEGRGNADLLWMGRLRRLIADGRFDVVHFHLPYTAALGRLVVATIPSTRRPAVVYTEHSLWNKMRFDQRAQPGHHRPRPGPGGGVGSGPRCAPPPSQTSAPGSSSTGWIFAFGCPDGRQGGGAGRGTGRTRPRRRRSSGPDRGQPASREGLRRSPRRHSTGGGPLLTPPLRGRGTRPDSRTSSGNKAAGSVWTVDCSFWVSATTYSVF